MPFPINRRISCRLTPWLAALRLSPNAVTGLSLAAGMLASWNLQQGTAQGWLLASLWLQAAYLLDNCDGELARLTGRSSGLGSWLDTVADCLIHAAFFFALGVGLCRAESNRFWLRMGIAAAAGVLLSYLLYVFRQVRRRGREAWRHPDPPATEEPQGAWNRLRKSGREDFSLIVIASALAHQMGWLLWLGLLGAYGVGLLDLFSGVAAGRRMAAERQVVG